MGDGSTRLDLPARQQDHGDVRPAWLSLHPGLERRRSFRERLLGNQDRAAYVVEVFDHGVQVSERDGVIALSGEKGLQT